jgi:hypothetical protein
MRYASRGVSGSVEDVCATAGGSWAFSTLIFALTVVLPILGRAQTWTALSNPPTFNASTALLLTDGTVMVQADNGYGGGQWWKFTPDANGSYVHGSWSQLASMPAGYTPKYFASAVLPDGRVLVEGGEYNGSATIVETSLGAIYQPTTNTWTSVSPPSGWSQIGDAQSVVLANGTFMLGNCCTSQQALFNASSMTWTLTGSGKHDPNSQEGWTLLPSGKVLTVDTNNGTQSELYDPSTGSWSLAGSTGNSLVAPCIEVGPAVLRPDGSVFAEGGTSYTAVYSSSGAYWSNGPGFPSGVGVTDGPAAILPNGNVLVMAGPNSPCYGVGATFYEFNGAQLTAVPSPPRAPSDPSFVGRMLVLPSGQILLTDGSTNVQVYTASGTYQASWQPVITSVPSALTAGSTYTVTGMQFNGLTQGAMYGDNVQSATNYPLVRITNNASGHVFYARTHGHTSMGVATGNAAVSTNFDLPTDIEAGASTLVVVANGTPSSSVAVTVSVPGDSGTMTEGMRTVVNINDGIDTTYRGYDSGFVGSYTPTALSGGRTLTAFYDIGAGSCGVCPATNGVVTVSGFSADPGANWLNSASANGVTKGGSTASYFYSNGSATWSWGSIFGFAGSGTTTTTESHH